MKIFLILLLYLNVAISENNDTITNIIKTNLKRIKELGYEEDVSKIYVDSELQELWRNYVIESDEYKLAKLTKSTTYRPLAVPTSSFTGSPPNIILKDIPRIENTEKLQNFTKIVDLSKNPNTTTLHNNELIERNGTIFDVRRQINSQAGMKDMQKSMNEAQPNNAPTARIEDIREPYWEDGHWVFERTPTPPPGRGETTSQVYFATTNPQDCDPFCSYYFKNHGVVCCHRYTVIQRKNEYKTFSNMCEMEQFNCRQLTKRKWHFYKFLFNLLCRYV
ncbi:unnamed protein product [Spodoptera littoralis]|uniref:Uncharacterized protein n=1 Tax=Spodoptera littoralis TaxID=7109 RepID=A0A9P0N5L9_SPOLI|nr:unnamed protein product [Spodoptera littoralis]CAH1642364.1 unnamed protein product [Spodoptera littoralis]